MVGKVISHYKIIEKLGEGGMGEVYLAEDTKLDRKVAIKFLPEHLTKDKENVERFEREAKAAAALNHPNIVTIYEIAEEDDKTFIVMEYVDGASLRTKIDEMNLTVEEILNITKQICEGLSKAHQSDIVHRDIKPENILIDKDGRVKILDFGLAKLKGVSKLTKETSTLGTIQYMSPEQIQGQEIDHRSDIWSVGVVIYELLSGKVPFTGDYEQAIIYAILNNEPVMDDIPLKLKKNIKKTLSKNQEARYQQIADFKIDISHISGKNIVPKSILLKQRSKKKSLYFVIGLIILTVSTFFILNLSKDTDTSIRAMAVLPFMNLKNDVKYDFLGYALADEIISDLSYLQNLTVRPASSVRKYHLNDVDPQYAGNELNVQYILTGNYQIESDDIRLHAELIHVHKNEIIWQGEIEDKYDHAFRIQDLVTDKVIDGLKIKFFPDELSRMKTDKPKNSIAFDYYQLSLVKPTTTKGNKEAIALLVKSIENDSMYAPAYNQLGCRIHNLTSYNRTGIRRLEEAEIALNTALRFNPELLSALGNLARIYTETDRLIEAQRLVKRMFAINKNNAFAHFVQGYIYRYAGLLLEARREMEMAVILDPTNKVFKSIGITYLFLEEYDNAFTALDIDEGSWYSLTYQGIALMHLGKDTIAREYFSSVIAMDPSSFLSNLSSAYQAYIDGNRSKGIQFLISIEQQNPPDSDLWYLISNVYALLDDRQGTIRTIGKAIEKGFYAYPVLKKYPNFGFIRNEPAFQYLLEKAKEKHEYYSNILLSK